MITLSKGHIVSINSLLALMYMAGLSDYCGSKAATAGLYNALESELEEHPNIHLTSVHPYIIDNDMFADMKLRYIVFHPYTIDNDMFADMKLRYIVYILH